jgi:hypothetical protein
MLVPVGAAAVLEVAGDRVVVVAVDRRDPAVLDLLADRIGMGPVADQVAAAVDRVDIDPLDRIQHSLQSRHVGVDVGDDCDPFHPSFPDRIH